MREVSEPTWSYRSLAEGIQCRVAFLTLGPSPL